MTEPLSARELAAPSPQLPSTGVDEPATATLALLAGLERSLKASQKALLGRDLAAIERCTEEQVRLSRALGIPPSPADPQPLAASEPARSAWLSCSPALATELCDAAKRVLALTRIQVALLDRARRSLRILSNLVAEPGGSYASVVLNRTSPASDAR